MTFIVIAGPTAIGKTRLAVRLARRINGEIISADSMQVYKGMRILSQAPTMAERDMVKHHLVEYLDPRKEYSAAAFRDNAARHINLITKRRKVPIVAGGSGLYIRALVDGLFPSQPADPKFRRSMQKFISKHGSKTLHQRLSKIDPDAAASIHPNDARRIIRALEIHRSTGRTMTELKAETHGLKDLFNIKIFGLIAPRDDIYANIDARTDRIFQDDKILDEVKRLKKKKLSKTAKAVLGYKEIAGYLNGEYDLETAKSLMKMNTRRFAKRQLAWFKGDRRIRWFDVSRLTERGIIQKIIAGMGSEVKVK